MGRKRIYTDDNARKRAYKARNKPTREEKQNEWKARPFIAIDGEGEDDLQKNHHYTMVTASNGSEHWSISANSLSTCECFDFLLSLKKKIKNGIFVGFSFNYDINMMLRDVDETSLRKLWKEGHTIWGKYLISWIPSKIFRVSEYQRGKSKPVNTITVYDVFGFFQKSFLGTLQDWNAGTVAQHSIIYQMKKQRGNFATISNISIHQYNTLECVLLVELMNKLRDALDTVDLRLTSWHGAGAVGGALLKKYEIDKHIEDIPFDIQNPVMCAYYGGRFQTLMLGEHFDAKSHDIRSAYPSAFLNLPSMQYGEWVATDEWKEVPYSLWYCEWDIPRAKKNITPFPHRYKRKISYPTIGRGWYWYPEVLAGKRFYNDKIKVLKGFIFNTGTDEKPFSFLEKIYQQRLEFKKQKNDAQLVLKLGINSVYGKTAQGTVRDGKKPKFQNYFWAGYCTSITRARIFEMSMRKPESVIAFATDGVFAREKLTTEEEDKNYLGNWEYGDNFYLFWAQSGVYLAIDKDRKKSAHDKVHRKTRGLGKNEVSFAKLRRQWRNKKTRASASDTVKIRRFFGLQYCLHTNNMQYWRTWREIDKTLSLWPNDNYKQIEETEEYIRFGQVGFAGIDSEPYVIKGSDTDSDNDEALDYYMDSAQPEWEG